MKKVLLFSTLSLFVASLASAQITPHFDVDFNQDTVGLPPAVGVEPFPSSQPTAIASFGLPDPIVVSAVGDLTDKPLKFFRDATSTQQYQQIRFVPPPDGTCGRYYTSFDLYIPEQQTIYPPSAGFSVFHDSPVANGFRFRFDGSLAGQPGNVPLGTYPQDTSIHVEIEFGGRGRMQSLSIDGQLISQRWIYPGTLNYPNSVRMGIQSLEDFEIGVDNIELGCGPEIRALPTMDSSGFAMLVILLLVGGSLSLGSRPTRGRPNRF